MAFKPGLLALGIVVLLGQFRVETASARPPTNRHPTGLNLLKRFKPPRPKKTSPAPKQLGKAKTVNVNRFAGLKKLRPRFNRRAAVGVLLAGVIASSSGLTGCMKDTRTDAAVSNAIEDVRTTVKRYYGEIPPAPRRVIELTDRLSSRSGHTFLEGGAICEADILNRSVGRQGSTMLAGFPTAGNPRQPGRGVDRTRIPDDVLVQILTYRQAYANAQKHASQLGCKRTTLARLQQALQRRSRPGEFLDGSSVRTADRRQIEQTLPVLDRAIAKAEGDAARIRQAGQDYLHRALRGYHQGYRQLDNDVRWFTQQHDNLTPVRQTLRQLRADLNQLRTQLSAVSSRGSTIRRCQTAPTGDFCSRYQQDQPLPTAREIIDRTFSLHERVRNLGTALQVSDRNVSAWRWSTLDPHRQTLQNNLVVAHQRSKQLDAGAVWRTDPQVIQSIQSDLSTVQRSLDGLDSAVNRRQGAFWGERTSRYQQQRQLALALEYQASFYRLR